jgi:hypothetical protein
VPLRYLASLNGARIVLWCYLIWYLVTVYFYFDPAPAIWINAIGISVVIGIALMLSVGGRARSGDRWTMFRLFLTPFCVSSFSSLVKDHGFILIVPPKRIEQLASFGACAAFLLLVGVVKHLARPHA